MCSARLESLDGWTRERERERENSENVLNQLIEKTLKIGYLGVRFTFVSDQKFQVNLSTKVMYDATLRSAVSDTDLFIQYPILDHLIKKVSKLFSLALSQSGVYFKKKHTAHVCCTQTAQHTCAAHKLCCTQTSPITY
jgi:hypothetical protein